MRTECFGVVLFAACLLALSRAACSEEVRGVVTDPSGAVISGAVVQVHAPGRIIASAKTDEKGAYLLQIEHQQAAAAALQISVTAPGFAAANSPLDFSRSALVDWSVRLEIAQCFRTDPRRSQEPALSRPVGHERSARKLRKGRWRSAHRRGWHL